MKYLPDHKNKTFAVFRVVGIQLPVQLKKKRKHRQFIVVYGVLHRTVIQIMW